MTKKLLVSVKLSTILFALFLCASCAQSVSEFSDSRPTERAQAPFGNLEITPYFGNVVYAAQPDEATVKMLKDQEFDLVINIRELNEDLGFDEKGLVEGQGITYMQIPYLDEPNFDADFSNDALSEIKTAIDDATARGQKILLHCSHGQRAASSLGMILYRDYGYSKEDAFKAATDAGMNSEWAVPKFWKFVNTSPAKVESFGGIKNMVKYKNFYIASQPSIEAINMMEARGITTVITNRSQVENGGFDEKKYVEEAGLRFHRARIYNDRYGDINDGKINIEELKKALDIIATTTDGDVFIHCGSADRASIITAIHSFEVDGSSAKQSLSRARMSGLKNSNITEQVEIYLGLKEE